MRAWPQQIRTWLSLLKPESYVNFIDFLVGCLVVLTPAALIGALGRIALVFLSFGVLLYPAIYLLNDILDLYYDRKHPVKKERPLAAGEITAERALVLALLLAIAGLAVGLTVSVMVCWFELIFLGINLAYTVLLKKVPYLDLLGSTSTHPLRTIFAIALFGNLTLAYAPIIMAVGLYWFTYNSLKRHQELAEVGEHVRPSLNGYSLRSLAFGAIVSTSGMVPLYGFLNAPLEYLILTGYFIISAGLIVGYFRGRARHKEIVHFMLKN